MNAVRWLTEPRAIAVLVTDSGLKKLAAQLYHFGASDREMGARFLILTPGRYRVTLAGSDGRMLTDQVITVDKRVARIAFRLPARQLCLLQVSEVLE
jgi:hypothetical protein